MDIGKQNEIWAKALVDGLIHQGVDYFCCAPGSRSTPLALAIASHPKAKSMIHFDERGLCFLALGYGKAAKKPAAVIVTSGTAVGNLMPAVMEASYDHIPLILLSADRPPELRDCGANQTCDQVKIFASFVRWQIDLPCPHEQISNRYLASTVSHAVMMATSPPAGPVHINCMFRDPLFPLYPEQKFLHPHVEITTSSWIPSEKTIRDWSEKLSQKRRGVIVVGSTSNDLSAAVFSLVETLKWPVFADILSSLRERSNHPALISHFDLILKCKNQTKVDAVIQLGNRIVSKTLTQWLEKQTLEFYLQILDHPIRQDSQHIVTHRLITSPFLFSKALTSSLNTHEENDWLKQWSQWNDQCKQTLTELFLHPLHWSEPQLMWEIASLLTEDWNLFLGNSMPIRDANQFFSEIPQNCSIFGNRGVSGIDGNIATACGLAQGNDKATFAVIGDLTFLHDLNSLHLVATSKVPLVLCVINNGGGGIFSFLPIAKRKEIFETFIAASHGLHFEAAANLFHLPYFHPQTPEELKKFFLKQKQNPYSCLIEISTDRTENVRVHEQILLEIGTCLNSAEEPLEIPTILH